ncbi:MAG: hemerythrin domain-containing protein [Lewinellaceae bacterium]|nr:hemerythrin domain-containing protein [Lewinellaceae bacterium]
MQNRQQTLHEVCEERHLDKDLLENSLKNLSCSPGHQDPHWNYAGWDTRFLVDFIIHAHHKYIRETLPVILRTGEKIAGEAGLGRVRIQEIHHMSQALSDEVTAHLETEERVIFPYILDLEAALKKMWPLLRRNSGGWKAPSERWSRNTMKP